MTNFPPEMIEKAKAAKTAEELLALAKENNVEMTEEEAKAYYAQLNPVSGELSDDELDNVAGGGCHKGDRLVVTAFRLCTHWECKKCPNDEYDKETWMHTCEGGGKYMANCTNCALCSYEGGLWLCNNPYC